jgi:hypothetical protein
MYAIGAVSVHAAHTRELRGGGDAVEFRFNV